MIDVICYGIVCLDYIWRVPHLPTLGGGTGITEEATLLGGEAANTAIALQKWGASVHLAGAKPGTDERGLKLWDLLGESFPRPESLGVFVDPECHTAWCTCVATPDGHRTMFGRGFNRMSCTELSPEAAASARFFTIDSTGYMDEGRRAVAVVADAGVPILAMDCHKIPEVCAKADVLQVSGGEDEEAPDSALLMARELRETYNNTVIVTRGSRGCVLADRDGTELTVPAYPVAEVVDSTGSGDTFRAGYLFGRLQGWDRLQTLRFASAAAALNCGAMGAWCGVQDLEATLAFMRAHDDAEVVA